MLIGRTMLKFMLLIFCGASFSDSCQRMPIEKEVLNNEVHALYKKFGFISILEDGEYSDLKLGEKYWLAIDSRHEYLTLRTMDNKVVEAIIHNPDLVTERAIGVGSSIDNFKKAYPNALKLTHYSTGVKRQWEAYFIFSENIEVNFSFDGVVNELRLKQNVASFEGEVLNRKGEALSNDNQQLFDNVLSTYTDCEGNPASAWVIISPDKFPDSFREQSATLKFLVGEDSLPHSIGLVSGSTEIAEWSMSSLLKSRFPNEPSNCWIVKYEYVDEASVEN